MNAFTIILSLIVLLTACKEKTETTVEVKEKSQSLTLEPFLLTDIANHEIMKQGCICTFGTSEDQFLYADNRIDMAIIKIDGSFVQLKAIVAEEVNEKNEVLKQYENEKYIVEFKGKRSQIPKADEASRYDGSIEIKSKDGEKLTSKSVFGICAC